MYMKDDERQWIVSGDKDGKPVWLNTDEGWTNSPSKATIFSSEDSANEALVKTGHEDARVALYFNVARAL